MLRSRSRKFCKVGYFTSDSATLMGARIDRSDMLCKHVGRHELTIRSYEVKKNLKNS